MNENAKFNDENNYHQWLLVLILMLILKTVLHRYQPLCLGVIKEDHKPETPLKDNISIQNINKILQHRKKPKNEAKSKEEKTKALNQKKLKPYYDNIKLSKRIIKKKPKKKTPPHPSNLNKRLLTNKELNKIKKNFRNELMNIHTQNKKKAKRETQPNESINFQFEFSVIQLILDKLDQFSDVLLLRQTCKFIHDSINQCFVSDIKDHKLIQKFNDIEENKQCLVQANKFFSFFYKPREEQLEIMNRKLAIYIHSDKGSQTIESSKPVVFPEAANFYYLNGYQPVLSDKSHIVSLFMVPKTFLIQDYTQSTIAGGFWKKGSSYKVTGRSICYSVPDKTAGLIAIAKIDNQNTIISLNEKIDLAKVKVLLDLPYNSSIEELTNKILNTIKDWRENCLANRKNNL